MKSGHGQEDGKEGITLDSDLVLSIDPQAASRGFALPSGTDAAPPPVGAVVDQWVVLSTLRSGERTLLALVDGHRSIQELVRLSGLSDDATRRHLRSLCDKGILVPVAAVVPENPASTTAPGTGGNLGSRGIPEGLSKALSEYLDSGKTAVNSDDSGKVKVDRSGKEPSDKIRTETAAFRVPQGGDRSSGSVRASETSGSLRASETSGSVRASENARASGNARVGDEPARDESSGKEPSAASPLGVGPDSGRTTIPGVSSDPVPEAQAPQPSQAVFRPNVTAFWLPAMPELSSSRSTGAVESEVLVRDSSSKSTVVITDSARTVTVATKTVPAPVVSPATPVEAMPTGGSGQVSAGASIPFRVGGYEVATRIAQGGMGSIYVCRRVAPDGPQRLFTLKVVRQHSEQKVEAVKSFERESRIGALLNHPNLQTVVDVGSYEDQPFLILDYIEGTNLSELIANDKKPPMPFVVTVLLDVLRGLHAAHGLQDQKGARLGLVHGDISPQNILVGVDGAARLTDFGSARLTTDGMARETGPVAMGKPAFMAPEQLCGEPLDARTDIFSVGAVLWTALTGQPLFAAESYDQIVMKVLRKKVPPPSDFGAPAYFDEIILTALSRHPDGRYDSAEALARALLTVATANGLVASPYEVGQWVRREFADQLTERRRRIQVAFGGAGRATTPVHRGAGGSEPNEGATSADGFVRLPARTVMLPNVRRTTPKLRSLSEPAKKVSRRKWPIVVLSALIALPFTLTITYLISNFLVSQSRPSPPSSSIGVPDGGQAASASPFVKPGVVAGSQGR